MLRPSLSRVGGGGLLPFNFYVFTLYRLEAGKRNLRSEEPEASVASGGFLIAKISLTNL